MAIDRPIKPVILSCEGPEFTDADRQLIRKMNPFGFIIFRRSCINPAQVKKLTGEFRALVERADAPVLIDQEGGRVARLREPEWREFPAPSAFANYNGNDAPELAFTAGQLMGAQCRELGVTVNCAPMIDLPAPDAHAGVIGSRVFGQDAETITRLAAAYTKGMISAGVLPIMKHIPGHGRATADSHEELPVVNASRAELETSDFLPFKNLAKAMPLAMTAHVLYPALDATRPATQSPKIINDIIRGHIGFDGLLVADTLEMKALSGTLTEKTQSTIAAGCDVVLYCPGDLTGNSEVLNAAPDMTAEALARWARALTLLPPSTATYAKWDDAAYADLTDKLADDTIETQQTVDSIVAHL